MAAVTYYQPVVLKFMTDHFPYFPIISLCDVMISLFLCACFLRPYAFLSCFYGWSVKSLMMNHMVDYMMLRRWKGKLRTVRPYFLHSFVKQLRQSLSLCPLVRL